MNQNPEAMYPLLLDLENLGFTPYLLKLPGHTEKIDLKKVNHALYLTEYRESYRYLESIYGNELYFLGYSFGGLIGVHLLNELKFKKMILLAPSLKLKLYTFALKVFLPFFKKIKSVTFFNEEIERKYRYHLKGVPREIYESFFSIFKEFSRNQTIEFKEIEGLVFCHLKDELVDQKKLWSWLDQQKNWERVVLENTEAQLKKFNHLCVDKETLGEESYLKLLSRIKKFLNKDNHNRI